MLVVSICFTVILEGCVKFLAVLYSGVYIYGAELQITPPPPHQPLKSDLNHLCVIYHVYKNMRSPFLIHSN